MKEGWIIGSLLLVLLAGPSVSAAGATSWIGSGEDPAISEQYAVWKDESGKLHCYDLVTQTDTLIAVGASSPDIDGGVVVWRKQAGTQSRIAVYDAALKASRPLDAPADEFSRPQVSGQRIVWSAEGKVYLYDLSVSRVRVLASGTEPYISGECVTYLYSDAHYERPAVFLYDLMNGKAGKLPLTGDLAGPKLDGRHVVAADFYTRMGYLQVYDLEVGRLTIATDDGSYAEATEEDVGCDTGLHYALSGERLVYFKSTHDLLGYPGLWSYDLASGESVQLYNESGGAELAPDIAGDYVVFSRTSYEADVPKHDIFLMKLDNQSAPAIPLEKFSAKQLPEEPEEAAWWMRWLRGGLGDLSDILGVLRAHLE